MNSGFVKIYFELNPADWHGCPGETLWAKSLSGKSSTFVLENSPFYAKGASYLDVVEATERNGHYEFLRTIAPSGHSTYRLLVSRSSSEFDTWWKKLHDMGCSYESGDFKQKKLYAVDVPGTTDIYAVYKILEEGEKMGIWIFEEGHVGHPLKKSGLIVT